MKKFLSFHATLDKDIEFIENFSKIFDCRVNFSKDLVGHKSLGGTWDFDTYRFAESAANNIVSLSGKDFPFSYEGLENWEYTLVTIDASQVTAFLADPTNFAGYSASATVTITGTITHAQATQLDAVAAAKYVANVSTTDISDLKTITTNRGVNTNEFDFSVATASVTAADLITLNTITASAVSLGSVTTITGTAAQLTTVYTAHSNSEFTGLGNEALTVSDANITSAQANTIDGYTTGAVTATISTTAIADLDDLTGTGNAYTITVGTAQVTAAALNTVNAATTVNVTATAVTQITGSAAELATTYGGGITGLGNETIILTDTTLAAATLTPTVNGYSSVAINANSVATLTGTNAEIIAAYACRYRWNSNT